jgi:ABC-type antimicrobial peptide transport system permease subunit
MIAQDSRRAFLVTAGVYGVMAYIVNQRRAEFGIRFALGATPRDVTRLVLSQGLAVSGAGVALGLLMAAAVSQFLRGQLFEIASPWIRGSTSRPQRSSWVSHRRPVRCRRGKRQGRAGRGATARLNGISSRIASARALSFRFQPGFEAK